MKGISIFRIIFLIFSISCNNSTQSKVINKQRPGKEEIADINTYFVQKDRERILSYIERKQLSMKETKSGLWYYIKNEGSGKYFAEKDKVTFNYVCSLLDGTICYNSDKLGPRDVFLGKSEMEAGLNEGLRLLRPGGEAVFILPPFLAFGLVGDGKSISSRAILVYEIRILNGK
jgi:FKBP-type peptidyl-prolyl cis-trans isomerase FkpA